MGQQQSLDRLEATSISLPTTPQIQQDQDRSLEVFRAQHNHFSPPGPHCHGQAGPHQAQHQLPAGMVGLWPQAGLHLLTHAHNSYPHTQLLPTPPCVHGWGSSPPPILGLQRD